MEVKETKKTRPNAVEVKVISDGTSLQSLSLLYTSCSGKQNSRPTINPK